MAGTSSTSTRQQNNAAARGNFHPIVAVILTGLASAVILLVVSQLGYSPVRFTAVIGCGLLMVLGVLLVSRESTVDRTVGGLIVLI